MAKPRAILNRAKSIKSIAKITDTMYKIAAAKFKRAFDRAVAARPYTDKLTRLIGDLARAAGGDFDHPLLEVRPTRKATQYVMEKAIFGEVDGYELSLSNSGQAFVRFNHDTAGSAYKLLSNARYPTDGETWMHLAATFDNVEDAWDGR